MYKLYPTDIYYIETIDRRTYLYTASQVYESSENLQWIV
ncbi:LytTR family transcriptional regulator DNA-binding domain-containing protein [Roseburia inulinivorans]